MYPSKYIFRVLISCLLTFFFSCVNNEVNTPKEKLVTTEDSLKKLIAANPDSMIAKENLLQFYRDSGMYDLAIRSNLTFLQNDSFNPRLHHIQALLYLENDDSSKALTYFSKAYNLYNNPFDLVYAGAIYARQGNKNALICSDTLLAAYKEKSAKEAWLIRGVYYASISQDSKALSCFDSAIYVRFSFTEAYIEKAKTLKKLNRFKDAVSTLEKATTINNNLPEAYSLMGECYEKLHESDLAIQAYEQALMYDPENEIAIASLKRLTAH